MNKNVPHIIRFKMFKYGDFSNRLKLFNRFIEFFCTKILVNNKPMNSMLHARFGTGINETTHARLSKVMHKKNMLYTRLHTDMHQKLHGRMCLVMRTYVARMFQHGR